MDESKTVVNIREVEDYAVMKRLIKNILGDKFIVSFIDPKDELVKSMISSETSDMEIIYMLNCLAEHREVCGGPEGA